jgi:signal transduction histidine kinase
VDQPPRRLIDRVWNRAATEEWLRWFWLWDTYFAIGYLAVAVVLLQQDEPLAARMTAIGLLSAMAGWYVAYGRPAITTDRAEGFGRGRIFVAGLVLLLAAAVAVNGSASFALFAICPMVFMSMVLREAIAVVVLVNLVPALSVLIRDGASMMFSIFAPGVLFTVALSVMMGTWITRVIAQSEERAALIKELEASREEISRLSREAGVAAERSRLAAEIHDTLAQGFTSLVTLVQAAESELDGDRRKARRHLELAARTARENLDEARALVAGLMPSALGTGTLDDAIQRQVDRLAEETGIRVSYEVDGELNVPTVVEVVLLRAVQESLTNVRKHSGAREVSIRLRANAATVSLAVADDGGGFDPDRIADGFGLRGMRARATQLGGSLEVHSGQKGTTVELEVPR